MFGAIEIHISDSHLLNTHMSSNIYYNTINNNIEKCLHDVKKVIAMAMLISITIIIQSEF